MSIFKWLSRNKQPDASEPITVTSVPEGPRDNVRLTATKAAGANLPKLSFVLQEILTLPPDEKMRQKLAEWEELYSQAAPERRPLMPKPITAQAENRLLEYVSLSKDAADIAARRHYDGEIFVIDEKSRTLKSSLHPEGQGWFELKSSGDCLITVAKNGLSLVVYSLGSKQIVQQTRELPGRITRFSQSPDGIHVAIAYEGGFVIWNLPNNSIVAEQSAIQNNHPQVYRFVAWSHDSAFLAVAGEPGGAVYSSSNWTPLYKWKGPIKNNYQYPVMALGFTERGTLIAGDNLGCLNVIDFTAQQLKPLSAAEAMPVFAISGAPKGTLIAVGRGNGGLELWDTGLGHRIAVGSGHEHSSGATKYLECIQWFPDGQRLCTWGGYDVRLWSIQQTPGNAV